MHNQPPRDDETWCDGIPRGTSDLSEWELLTETLDSPSFLQDHSTRPAATFELTPYHGLPQQEAPLPAAMLNGTDPGTMLTESSASPYVVIERRLPQAGFTMTNNHLDALRSSNACYYYQHQEPYGHSFQGHRLELDDRTIVNSARSKVANEQDIKQPKNTGRFPQSMGLNDASSAYSVSCGMNLLYPPSIDQLHVGEILEAPVASTSLLLAPVSDMTQTHSCSNQVRVSRSEDWSYAGGDHGGASNRPASVSKSSLADSKKFSGPRDFSSIKSSSTMAYSHPPQLPVMCQPLTAYNYFYRNERNTIVHGMMHPDDHLPPSDGNFSPEKKAELLHQHW
jgi:hypothetical protein